MSNHRRRLAVTLIFAAAVSATGIDIAIARNASAVAAVSSVPLALSPVDYNFVAQANLGAPFRATKNSPASIRAMLCFGPSMETPRADSARWISPTEPGRRHLVWPAATPI